MSAPCFERNPLARDGASQPGRDRPALDPASAPLDGRALPEWLAYLRAYAAGLIHVSESGAASGDWTAFLARDPSVTLAGVLTAGAGAALVRAGQRARVLVPPGGRPLADARRDLGELMGGLFAAIERLDDWLGVIASTRLGLPELLRASVVPALRLDLRLLIGVYKAAADAHLIDGDGGAAATRVLAAGLNELWWKVPPAPGQPAPHSWAIFESGISADTAALGEAGAPDITRIARVVEYLDLVLADLVSGVAAAEAVARRDFDETLGDWPTHEPHLALLLAFLRLYAHGSAELDRVTARHLDFHQRQVLGLVPRQAEADRAYVVFTLAKQADSAVLAAGTQLKAGKDPDGRELQYALADDLRLNRAVAGPFLTIGRRANAGAATPGQVLRAATIGDQPGWSAFGSVEDAPAPVGFAVAGSALLLAEGRRKIELSLSLSPAPAVVPPALESDRVEVALTTAKGWQVAPVTTAQLDGVVSLTLELDAKFPPLVAYAPALHGPGYAGATGAVCRVRVLQDPARAQNYGSLAGLTLTGVGLRVIVADVRQPVVVTESGRADPSKAFAPFGAVPLPRASFLVHHPELSGKHLVSLTLGLDWKNLPESLEDYFDGYPGSDVLAGFLPGAFLMHLNQGATQWGGEGQAAMAAPSQPAGVTFTLTPSLQSTQFGLRLEVGKGLEESSWSAAGAAPLPSELLVPVHDTGALPPATDTVRVSLQSPPYGFGHRVYPQVQTAAALALAQAIQHETELPSLPNPPFTPMLSALTLGYVADAHVSFGAPGELSFHHLHPFGAARADGDAHPRLVPTYDDEGQLLFGLAQARAEERVSVLFRLDEGTADPRIDAPTLIWEYLGAGGFQPLAGERLHDGTEGFAHTGIVHVILPAAAFAGSELLPEGRAWVRARAPRAVAATSRVVAVATQAALAVLVDPQGHPRHAFGALPPETITKPAARTPALKAVAQPAPSFGGRPPEDVVPFRRRVSERLRHKRRAVTIHDYEALVLEAFPDLYKVKCLNHTRFDAGGDREIAPGHVTMVVVPDLRARRPPNPFEPLASQATLKAVRAFLQPLVGGHVELDVVNAVFERVRVSLHVRFRPGLGDDPALALERLGHDLDAHLSPWAFAPPDRGASDIVFGGRLYRSQLLHFVETRDYVDFVTEVRLDRLDAAGLTLAVDDPEIVEPASSRAILVSAGAHQLTPIMNGGSS